MRYDQTKCDINVKKSEDSRPKTCSLSPHLYVTENDVAVCGTAYVVTKLQQHNQMDVTHLQNL